MTQDDDGSAGSPPAGSAPAGSAPTGSALAGSLFAAESAELATRGSATRGSLAALNTLAVELCVRERVEEALPLLDRAADACRRVLGPRDPDTLVVSGNRAVAHAMLGRWADALLLLRANLAERAAALGDTHHATLDARDALAVTLRLAGNLRDAVSTHRLVTAQRLRELGPSHPDTLVSRAGLAVAESASGNVEIAAEILDDALAVSATHDGPPELGLVLRLNLALCLAAAGRTDPARELLAAVLTECEARYGHNDPETAFVRHELARVRGPEAG